MRQGSPLYRRICGGQLDPTEREKVLGNLLAKAAGRDDYMADAD